jgi:hypothetical protein
LKKTIVNVLMDIMIMVKPFVNNVLIFVLPVPHTKPVLNVLTQELCPNVIAQMVNGIITEFVNLVITCVKLAHQVPLIVLHVPKTESTNQHVTVQTISTMITPTVDAQNVAVNVLLALKMDVFHVQE